MNTCYFDRNIFDHIDKKCGITDEDLALLRKAVADEELAVLVSFETIQETSYANKETALRGLELIQELSRAEFPIKPHNELLKDDIKSFAEGQGPQAPYLLGKLSIDAVIADIQNPTPEFLRILNEDKREKEVLNESLARYLDDERRALGGERPRTFGRYWDLRSTFYGEGFAYFAGYLKKSQELGIDKLLEVRSVRLTVGAFLSLLYSVIIEGHAVKDGTSRDIQHVGPMSAADIVVTDDGELRRLLKRVPLDNLSVMSLPELIALLRSEAAI